MTDFFSLSYKPKLRPVRIISHRNCALCYEYSTGRLFIVNKVGELILKYCNGSLTVRDIVNRIREKIADNVEANVITRDILEFLRKLMDLRLLQNEVG